MKRISKFLLYAGATALFQIATAPGAFAAPILGAALASFAVLGAEGGVTNVPTSTIGGNLGATNPSIGGGYVFTAGGLEPNTALAKQAQLDLDDAIVAVSAFGPGTLITGGNLDAFQALNGGVISPGTYTVPALITPNLALGLILDGGGSNSAVWVFQMESTLITSTSSTVIVQNVGDGANVGIYWNVRSAATLDGPTFAGNVLAHDLISSDGNLTIACGRLLSAETQVTLIQDNISIGCAGFEKSGGFDQGNPVVVPENNPPIIVPPIPEPGTLLLLGTGIVGLVARRRRSA